MVMYVVRLNPDTRGQAAYSKYPTADEYKAIHESSPMDGFHEAANFLPEHGVVRGYLPPRHLSSMRDGKPFVLLTITAKTAKSGGDKIVGVQSGCVYSGETRRRGGIPALGLTWHYHCPASLSFLFPEPVPNAREIVLGGNEKWIRGPTFKIDKARQQRIVKALIANLKDSASKKRLKLLIDGASKPLAVELESESTFEGDVVEALKANLSNVKGNPNPRQKEIRTFQYERDPKVVAYTLMMANGVCSDCKNKGPFISKITGLPYLEVHHVRTLKDGGSDTTDNVVALCPNCHRARHYG